MTIEQLLEELASAREELKGYITSSSTTGGGGSTAVQLSKVRSVNKRIRDIRRELNLKDPEHYPVNQPLRRTTPYYT